MQKKMLLVLLFICIFGIFYYSWLPDPKLASETYLPKWLINWSNHYFNLRTAIPFLGFGFLMEMWRATPNQKKTTMTKVLKVLTHTALGAIIVSIAEGGQYLLIHRHPDSLDLLYGILGSILGSLLYYVLNIFIELNFYKNGK
jgi:glycopeptide antibiotics resistance protein